MFVWSELEVSIASPSFVTLHLLVSEIAKCMVFIVVLQELHCLLQCLLLVLWCVY